MGRLLLWRQRSGLVIVVTRQDEQSTYLTVVYLTKQVPTYRFTYSPLAKHRITESLTKTLKNLEF